MEQLKPTNKEMLEAIERSGYLLESEISKLLSQRNFFVEPNQVIIDPITGKSREIDLVAEFYDRSESALEKQKCISKVHFVFEIKNNSAPLVLLTEFEWSPNVEQWLAIKEIQTYPEKLSNIHLDDYHTELINNYHGNIFTQYCSFQRKKQNSELMALHPDNIHTGLGKISQYCEERVEVWGRTSIDNDYDYFRNFVYLPILLISEDLYELSYNKNGNTDLKKVESSILVHNYHYKNTPNMAFIFIVTRKGFEPFMENVLKLERKTEDHMIEIKSKLC